ncbi:glutaredoxin family protein [Kocuria sp.]|uniref:glutaredoxin family protein n=1 Tax=Kocuria sp. TaxID=1871328 RepID=UPI0026DC1216|nr:glutaredoxin family protein [Kocuria sp.]MDO4920062.1 glutaredoxin family protein [Kocuria sp.]
MTHPAVTVYTKPSCPSCVATKRRLRKRAVDFTEVDVTQDQSAYDFITAELGHQAAPVVYASDGETTHHWSGYRPDLITTHITGK